MVQNYPIIILHILSTIQYARWRINQSSLNVLVSCVQGDVDTYLGQNVPASKRQQLAHDFRSCG